MSQTRNIRSIWTITTKPFKEAHFATFPPELPEKCIKAGTSEKGVCPECGAPWVRIVEKSGGTIGQSWHDHSADMERGTSQSKNGIPMATFKTQKEKENPYTVQSLGWRPSCTCRAGEPIPATVLDPFAGAGTTGVVAKQLGRDFILIELKREYCEMAEKRISRTFYQGRLEIEDG